MGEKLKRKSLKRITRKEENGGSAKGIGKFEDKGDYKLIEGREDAG